MRAACEGIACRLFCAGLSGSEDSDEHLISAARQGDPSAFEDIVRRHQRRVYNLAYRMLRDHDDAEDLTQEAFLRVFQSLPRIRDDRALGAYVTRVAANLCITWLRARRRRPEQSADPADLA